MSAWDAVPIVGPLIGAATSAFGQHSANQANRDIATQTNVANAQQAHDQMAFQERMANTAVQRQMADLKLAGVNPMLVAGLGGSSTPPGASIPAQQAHEQQNIASGASGAANSAIDALRTNYEIKNMRETNAKIRSDTELNKAMRVKANADTNLTNTNARVAQSNSRITAAHVAGAESESRIDKTKYGKILRYLGRLNPFANSALSVSKVVK
jgi:hypothetical protein